MASMVQDLRLGWEPRLRAHGGSGGRAGAGILKDARHLAQDAGAVVAAWVQSVGRGSGARS